MLNKTFGILFPLFQFHKGAIRTWYETRIKYQKTNFNSIKVRLERTIPHYYERPTTTFQFHKGAIRTRGRNT